MFAIFSRYNPLFVRPHIRSAIREYQTTLIERVRTNIDELQSMFFVGLAKRFVERIDIPEFFDKIIFIRNIEQQLNMHMKRIENVLGGEQWDSQIEGIIIVMVCVCE